MVSRRYDAHAAGAAIDERDDIGRPDYALAAYASKLFEVYMRIYITSMADGSRRAAPPPLRWAKWQASALLMTRQKLRRRVPLAQAARHHFMRATLRDIHAISCARRRNSGFTFYIAAATMMPNFTSLLILPPIT